MALHNKDEEQLLTLHTVRQNAHIFKCWALNKLSCIQFCHKLAKTSNTPSMHVLDDFCNLAALRFAMHVQQDMNPIERTLFLEYEIQPKHVRIAALNIMQYYDICFLPVWCIFDPLMAYRVVERHNAPEWLVAMSSFCDALFGPVDGSERRQ